MTHRWQDCNSPFCLDVPQLDRAKQLRLGLMLVIIFSFALVEWIVGTQSHSLALRSDAWHMVADSGAILIALSASWLTRLALMQRLPQGTYPDIIAASFNASSLILMSVWIAWEGIEHLLHPPTEILTTPMLMTASLGLVVNLIGIALLHNDSHQNLNVRGAFLHMLADLASSGGVIVGALAIYNFDCFWLDSCISLLIVVFILKSALDLLQLSWQQWQYRKAQAVVLPFLEIGHGQLMDVVLGKTDEQFRDREF